MIDKQNFTHFVIRNHSTKSVFFFKKMMRIITIFEPKMGHFKSKVIIRFHATKSDLTKKNQILNIDIYGKQPKLYISQKNSFFVSQ
jgi:hypothetical protein